MDFRTALKIEPSPRRIAHSDIGLMIGSCFTDSMGAKMAAGKMAVEVNPFGVVYNPLSVAGSLRTMERGGKFPDAGAVERDGLWFDFALHGSFSATSREALLEKADAALTRAHRALQHASYLIITLGTAWVYEYIETGEAVCNCHKVPESKFRRYRLAAEDIVGAFDELLREDIYRNKHIIFTVSPVRHLKDGLAGNGVSKAALITAVHALAERYDNVDYFPAYEIMMDDLRDYRFYKSDMIHPSDVAVDYIWERFSEAFLTPQAREANARMAKIAAALAHRPFNPDTAAHSAFRRSLLAEVEAAEKEYPYLDLTDEKAVLR